MNANAFPAEPRAQTKLAGGPHATMMRKGRATMRTVGDLLGAAGAASDQSPHHGIAGGRGVAVDGRTLRRMEAQVTRGQGHSELKSRANVLHEASRCHER